MGAKYCQECGRALVLKEIGDEGAVPFCIDCNKPYLSHPLCCILVAVVDDEGQVVLLRQNYVSKTNWVLIAGHIKEGETLEQTVAREVSEETGLNILDCEYVNSYPYESKGMLMLGFVAHSKYSNLKHESKEVDDLKWEDIDQAVSLLRNGSIGQKHLLSVIEYLNRAKVAQTGCGS